MTRSLYIVDDNSGGRALLHCLLAVRSGQIVRSFRDGDEFLKCAPELAPGVVLLDFARGMDVLENIRESDQKKYAPIILVGEGNLELAVQAMKAGALELVEKPFEARQLLSAVDAAFSGLAQDRLADARIQRARAQVASLSPRERQVLSGLVQGSASDIIAKALDVSSRTVENYRNILMAKLNVGNVPGALRVAFAAGMMPQT